VYVSVKSADGENCLRRLGTMPELLKWAWMAWMPSAVLFVDVWARERMATESANKTGPSIYVNESVEDSGKIMSPPEDSSDSIM